jgi:hypothetical protein
MDTPNIFSTIIFPLIVVIIGLLIEYWGIQPLRQRQITQQQNQITPKKNVNYDTVARLPT